MRWLLVGGVLATSAAVAAVALLAPKDAAGPADQNSSDRMTLVVDDGGFVATLRESTAAVWSNGAAPLDVGGRVGSGELRLGAGRADLVLDSGVRIVVEGPADLAIESADSAFLRSGKVAVYVPQHAIGFTLTTPTSTLVDQGTEFGVVADDSGATEVHVFRGQVDLVYPADGDNGQTPRHSLTDRQAWRVAEAGTRGAGVEFSPATFRGLADQIVEPILWSTAKGGNGHYYQIVVHEAPLTWQQAALDAYNRYHKGLPGHLLTVTSEEEHRFVVNRLIGDRPLPSAWMGITDVLREGYFRWVTGEPVEYECWAVAPLKQPDNYIERQGHGGEDYGMYTSLAGAPWAWNDLSNDSIHQTVWVSLVEYEPTSEDRRDCSIASEPIGWTRDLGGDGQHYRLVMSLQPLSWDEAAERASETSLLGVAGQLAAFETEAERDFVVDTILKVCGVAENFVGLRGESPDEPRWVTGAPLAFDPHTTPNIPTDRVYGQMRWLDGAWRLQTVPWERRPAGWFGYLVEYPAPGSGERGEGS